MKNRAVVGIISSADMLKLEFFLPSSDGARDRLLAGDFRLATLMHTPVITVSEHESIERASELMARHAIHSLPVVDRNDLLVGIVTTTDIIGSFLQSLQSSPDRGTQGARASLPTSYAQERLTALEDMFHEVRRYLNAGQDERLHRRSG